MLMLLDLNLFGEKNGTVVIDVSGHMIIRCGIGRWIPAAEEQDGGCRWISELFEGSCSGIVLFVLAERRIPSNLTPRWHRNPKEEDEEEEEEEEEEEKEEEEGEEGEEPNSPSSIHHRLGRTIASFV